MVCRLHPQRQGAGIGSTQPCEVWISQSFKPAPSSRGPATRRRPRRMPRIEKWARSPLGAIRHSMSSSELERPSTHGCFDAPADPVLELPERVRFVLELIVPGGGDSSSAVPASVLACRLTKPIEDPGLPRCVV